MHSDEHAPKSERLWRLPELHASKELVGEMDVLAMQFSCAHTMTRRTFAKSQLCDRNPAKPEIKTMSEILNQIIRIDLPRPIEKSIFSTAFKFIAALAFLLAILARTLAATAHAQPATTTGEMTRFSFIGNSNANLLIVQDATPAQSGRLQTPIPTLAPTAGTFTASENCNLSSPAFCETFNEGPAAIHGRGGDLDSSKWATSRLSGELGSSGQGTANPVMIAPITHCRAGIAQTSVYPPNDDLICDPSVTTPAQLMTAVSMQNYGVNSHMVRQPFDFSGRTGKIDFDVDAVAQGLGGFVEVELTDDPVPATTFREFQNYEVGPVPRDGLSLKLGTLCGNTDVSFVNTMVYNNYAGAIITPTFDHGNGCAKVSLGSLNHFEIQVSQAHVDVYGSDFSTDNGRTFPNYKLLYSADIILPFTRGYVHFDAKNHATIKYGFGPDVVFHWDNLGFDGPVISAPRAYEIPDNTTMGTDNGNRVENLGYLLLDGTKGKPAGMYSPTSKINSLAFQNVNTSGVTSATLTLNAFFQAATHAADATWGISYRFNGGTWRTHTLTAGDLADINAVAGAPLGYLSWALNVPVTDLVSGTNTLEFLPVNAPMDYPPVVANIDLLLGTAGSISPSPTPTPTLTPTPIPVSTKFTIGQRVQSTANVNVRSTAITTGTLLGIETTGSLGTIIDGPTTQGGTNEWKVRYDSGIAGWSAEGFLQTNVAPTPTLIPTRTPTPTPVIGNCGMQLGDPVTFCETFDNKNLAIPSRTGDLDPNVWGVSRVTGNANFGQGTYNGWTATTPLQTCKGAITVSPPNDILICNGQLHEATNDNPSGAFEAGNVTTLSMYPKQPFDFANRTGTVSFDISNDSHGAHSAWPEFWMSNLPVPAPFNHFDSWQALPEHGFGIRFGAAVTPGGWGECQNENNLAKRRWTVDSAVVVRNYVMDDTNALGGVRTNMAVQQLDCVISPLDNSGIMNHVELKISQNQIDVYATDAGVAPSPTSLRHITHITNTNLSFSRGLVWFEDVHYNADKGDIDNPSASQRSHTFVWDNVAFDGPFTYRDFSYDALDVGQDDASTNTVDLGKFSRANQTASWDVLNVPANPQASAVRVLFNFDTQFSTVPTILEVVVNGHVHPTPWPYPDTLQNTWRTFAVTVPITDLVSGTNVVQLGSDEPMITSNVNIVLVDVHGGVPVMPGSNNSYPAGGASPSP